MRAIQLGASMGGISSNEMYLNFMMHNCLKTFAGWMSRTYGRRIPHWKIGSHKYVVSGNADVEIWWKFDHRPNFPYNRYCGERNELWDTKTRKIIPLDGIMKGWTYLWEKTMYNHTHMCQNLGRMRMWRASYSYMWMTWGHWYGATGSVVAQRGVLLLNIITWVFKTLLEKLNDQIIYRVHGRVAHFTQHMVCRGCYLRKRGKIWNGYWLKWQIFSAAQEKSEFWTSYHTKDSWCTAPVHTGL